MRMKFQTYEEGIEYLLNHIPKQNALKHPGSIGLARAQYILKLLGNPQEKYQVIHIAGTSGKGSTAYITSTILHALGFKTSLFISPHVTDIRERCQINNEMVDKKIFLQYIGTVADVIEQVAQTELGVPTYFEILDALAYLISAEEQVDYAIIETGVGGLYDATNVVSNPRKINIITQLGFDHMNILGTTLAEIAYQKAMITHPGNTTIVLDTTPEAKPVFADVAKKQRSDFIYLQRERNIADVEVTLSGTTFTWSYNDITWNKICVSMPAGHQADNAALALTAVYLLSRRDNFPFAESIIRNALKHISVPGRIERKIVNGKDVIIDTAHNPQKMAALVTTLIHLFPHQKFAFLLAFKEDKDIQTILNLITPIASSIWLTTFSTHDQDFLPAPITPQLLKETLKKVGFTNSNIEEDPYMAYQKAIQEDKPLVITGSFYLVSQLYNKL